VKGAAFVPRGQKCLAPEHENENAQEMKRRLRIGREKVGLVTFDCQQSAQIEFDELFRARFRFLPVKPPYAAIGENAL
jgi:hypothetical protein